LSRFQEDFQLFQWQFFRSWNYVSLHEQKPFLFVKNKQPKMQHGRGNMHELFTTTNCSEFLHDYVAQLCMLQVFDELLALQPGVVHLLYMISHLKQSALPVHIFL